MSSSLTICTTCCAGFRALLTSSPSARSRTFVRNLRTKGKLTPADVDGTVREIRRALLDADVALPVVKDFTAKASLSAGR
jgi:signal recognition particle GTPase